MESFLAYSLPGSSKFVFAEAQEALISASIIKNDKHHFIASPFDKANHPSLALTLSGFKENTPFQCELPELALNDNTERKEYESGFHKIQEWIQTKDCNKIVLARKINFECNAISPFESFLNLVQTYPNAFSYFLHTKTHGTWMGASPELILNQTAEHYQTKAIAGTLSSQSNKRWTQKEIEEHKFIETYLIEALDRDNISFKKSEVKEIKAGTLRHLCSSFMLDKDLSIAKILNILHPSPALSGYPVPKAIDRIIEIESFDRELYCGMIGFLGLEKKLNIFANIRCAKLFRNHASIYVGGGITIDSILENEWKETALKANTIQSILHSKQSDHVE